MSGERAPRTRWCGAISGFESYHHLLRFCIALFVIGGLILTLVWLLMRHLAPGESLAITFNDHGSTVVKIANEPTKAIVVVPANQMWIDTGLDIKPGQWVTITASGRVNLAVHRLCQAADTDVRPRHSWIGPEGGSIFQAKPIDNRRKELLVNPNAKYGMLLACVQPSEISRPDSPNPRPREILDIGAKKTFKYVEERGRTGRLYLAVNDAVLENDQKSHSAYVTDQGIVDASYGPGVLTVDTLEARWTRLVSESYWHVWYDDNVGQYLVQVDFQAEI